MNAVPAMMGECMEYLEKRLAQDKTFQYEVIIVSDGSSDGTVAVAHKYAEKYSSDNVRVLALTENRGKGGAVRLVRLLLLLKKSCEEGGGLVSILE